MKVSYRLTIILVWALTSTMAHAQFNTIGDVNRHISIKPKVAQDSTAVVPGDTVGVRASLPIENLPAQSSLNILPYLSVSLPLKNIRISSRFGMRVHPIMHKYCLHNGIDLQTHYEQVFSMFPGEVVAVGQDKRSGRYVTIRTAGYTVSYCHLSSSLVSSGMFVNAGEIIGLSGNTGMSTGPHLHLTTKKDGKAIDPTILLDYIQSIRN